MDVGVRSLFVYANNDPLDLSDGSGLWPKSYDDAQKDKSAAEDQAMAHKPPLQPDEYDAYIHAETAYRIRCHQGYPMAVLYSLAQEQLSEVGYWKRIMDGKPEPPWVFASDTVHDFENDWVGIIGGSGEDNLKRGNLWRDPVHRISPP